jgi:hypothetical protein
MSITSKVLFGRLVKVAAVVLLVAGFASAQGSVVGTITFYPGGSTRVEQTANSYFTIGGHTVSCTQWAVWHDSEIQNGKSQMIVNTSSFGPCTIDGVFIRDLTLLQSKTGILFTINTIDGKCWSMMLANSAGVHLTDLTGIYFKGPYAANTVLGFNLVGSVQ